MQRIVSSGLWGPTPVIVSRVVKACAWCVILLFATFGARGENCLSTNDVEVYFEATGPNLYAQIIGRSQTNVISTFSVYKERFEKQKPYATFDQTNAVWATNLYVGRSRKVMSVYVCQSATGQPEKWYHYGYIPSKDSRDTWANAGFLLLGGFMTLCSQLSSSRIEAWRQTRIKRTTMWASVMALLEEVNQAWADSDDRMQYLRKWEGIKVANVEVRLRQKDKECVDDITELLNDWKSHQNTVGKQKLKILQDKVSKRS